MTLRKPLRAFLLRENFIWAGLITQDETSSAGPQEAGKKTPQRPLLCGLRMAREGAGAVQTLLLTKLNSRIWRVYAVSKTFGGIAGSIKRYLENNLSHLTLSSRNFADAL